MPRLGVSNIDRRGSSDSECCEKIFCRAEICRGSLGRFSCCARQPKYQLETEA